jgi:hypothetical protein
VRYQTAPHSDWLKSPYIAASAKPSKKAIVVQAPSIRCPKVPMLVGRRKLTMSRRVSGPSESAHRRAPSGRGRGLKSPEDWGVAKR